MAETEQGHVIRQFQIFKTSDQQNALRVHEIGAKAENVILSNNTSVQDAIGDVSSLQQSLRQITSNDKILLSKRSNDVTTLSASVYDKDVLTKANKVEFSPQEYISKIGCVWVTRENNGLKVSTSLKDFIFQVKAGSSTLDFNETYRIATLPSTFNSIILTSLSEKYCFKEGTQYKDTITISQTQAGLNTGELCEVYRKKLDTENTRSGISLSLVDLIYPIGSLYFTTNETPPNLLFGGIWERYAAGRCLIGSNIDGTGSLNKRWVGESGGEETHTLKQSETPLRKHTHPIDKHTHGMSHTHTRGGRWYDGKGSSNTAFKATKDKVKCTTSVNTGTSSKANTDQNSTGITAKENTALSGTGHNNMQPFIVVNIWRRVS